MTTSCTRRLPALLFLVIWGLLVFCHDLSVKKNYGVQVFSTATTPASTDRALSARAKEEAVANITTSQNQLVSTDADAVQMCSRSQLKNGEWKAASWDQPPYLPENHSKMSSCMSDDTALHVPWTDYEWVSRDNCQFDPFDSNTFCRAAQRLNISRIAIVGDSLTWEHYASLLMLLRVPVIERDQMISMEANVNIIHTQACDGQVQTLYRRDDYLTKVWDVLPTFHPDLLVLNRGAHYVPDEPLTMEFTEMLTNLTNFYQNQQQHGQQPKLIYRTTVPGHENCHAYTEPNNNLTQMEELIASSNRFQWNDFKRQNQLLLHLLEQHTSNTTATMSVPVLQVKIMDAYEINSRRPDKHKGGTDCLHSCFPGKMDVYSQILQHYMLLEDW
jgi:GDSL/SGNH-like Acyl-Esterase family found in Pmr5 and Cas1p